MEIKAKFNKKGNIKLGYTMWSFSKLYGSRTYIVAINGETLEIVGTCGGYCEGCEGSCYVKKSYRYPSVIKGHARNTLAFRNDLDKAFMDLDGTRAESLTITSHVTSAVNALIATKTANA